MKIQSKSTNLLHIIFICFVFILFVNCSGTDTPVQDLPSQVDDDNNGNADTGNGGNNGDTGGNSDSNSESSGGNNNNNDGNENGDNNDNNDNTEYNFTERSESPPDLRHIVEQIAQWCPEQMQALSDGEDWTGNLDFLDLVVAALRKEDKRWGYTFWDGQTWSPDVIGYYRGTDNPNGSNDMALLDYFIGRTDNPSISWHIGTYEEDIANWPNSSGEWRYPRPGATVSLSDCSGAPKGDKDVSDFSWDKVKWVRDANVSGWEESSEVTSVKVKSHGAICIDHTEKGQWPERPPKKAGDVTVEGNPWIIVKLDGKYYASTYEWLKPGQVCKLEELKTKGGLRRLYEGSLPFLTAIKNWTAKGGDVVGFMVSGLARHKVTPNTRKRTNIQWYRLPSLDGSISGQMLGTYSSKGDHDNNNNGGESVIGQCGSEPETCVAGDPHSSPKDTLEEFLWTCRNRPYNGEASCSAPRTAENCGADPHFKVVNGKCLPSCGSLASYLNPEKHQLQSGGCNTGWTRLGDSYEEENGQGVCCKKAS